MELQNTNYMISQIQSFALKELNGFFICRRTKSESRYLPAFLPSPSAGNKIELKGSLSISCLKNALGITP
jgi:hypothetical protein